MKITVRSHAVRCLFTRGQDPRAPRDKLDALIRRAAHGDRRAVFDLSYVLRPELLEEALRRVPADQAEDAVQELFARLLQGSLRPPRNRESAVAWLLRVLGNLAREKGLNLRENGLAEEKFENRPRGIRKNRNPYLYRAGATKRP